MTEQPVHAAAGDEPATLQSRLEAVEDGGPVRAGPAIADPAALLAHLDVSGHFHRDGRVGRMYHPGMVSLREDVPEDSLHVSVDDNRVMAHVDDVSPLAVDTDGASRYSVRRAVTHNLVGMARDLVLLLRGRQGDHRCVLDCEWVSGERDVAPDPAGLLDPATSAWSVHLEVRVAGTLDEARLGAALRAAVARPFGRGCLEVVECADDAALEAARARLLATGVPVTAFPPLYACLARHPDGDAVMLNVNHAAADGPGAVRVLQGVARAYAGDAVDALDFLLSRPELPVRPTPPGSSILTRCARTASARLRDLLSRPAQLAADAPADDPGYGIHLVALSAAQTRAVIDGARGVARRDVLMAALHLAIGSWNRRHGAPGGRIGVLAPADLRSEDWPPDAIANVSVNTRLSTRRHQRRGPAAAAKAVAVQSERSKRTRTGIALIAGLQRAGLLALWAKQSTIVLQPLTAHHRADAAMLADLGSLGETPRFGPDAGDTVGLWISLPTRSPLSVSIGAVTVQGRLHLTFRYPHRVFGPDGARRFADCYLAHLRRVAEGPWWSKRRWRAHEQPVHEKPEVDA
jgi:hypothetical protein